MIMILAGPADETPFGTEPICRIAKQKGVPVIVDAAADTSRSRAALRRGADMVATAGAMHSGSAVRRIAARAQGSAPGCLAAQRAASRLRPLS
jgi:O-acetylhomoserine/O-acetylserine sulfhydrylase-like pyridoxal-dependent enzyme